MGLFSKKTVDDAGVTDEAPKENFLKKLFGSKTKGNNIRNKKSSAETPIIKIIADDSGGFGYAFGFKWRTLVRAGGKKSAIEMVKKAKGNALIYRQNQMGLGVLPSKNITTFYSAATLVSKTTLGHALFAIRIAVDVYWFCVVKNGVVANRDEIFFSSDDAEIAQMIRSIAESMSGEQFTVYTDMENIGLTGTKNFTIADIVDILKTDDDRVDIESFSGGSIPKPVMVGSLVLLAVFGGKQLFNYWEEQKKIEEKTLKSSTDITPEEAWAPVFKTFLSGLAKTDKSSFNAARSQIGSLSVFWNGWLLSDANCIAQSVVDKKRTMVCNINYIKTPSGIVSSEMLVVTKKSFPNAIVNFPSVNAMAITLTKNINVYSIESVTELQKKDALRISIFDNLQKFGQSLQNVPEFSFVAVPMAVPNKLDGSPQPKPANIPEIYSAKIQISGPLRSIDYFVSRSSDVDWVGLSLKTDMKSKPKDKNLKSSSFNAELYGNIYAID